MKKIDKDYIDNTTSELEKRYSIEINRGVMEVVIPSEEFYPKIENKSELNDIIYNDPPERIIWRSNQNYDFSYLMAYSRDRGRYFLMLEDDVLSRNGFVSDILNFIQKVNNKQTKPWLMIEFSELGFIGKLFKSRSLIL